VNVAERLREAARALAETSDTPRLDAELLMAHALGVTRSGLLLGHMRDDAPGDFDALLERRLAHEPVAYIVGGQEFYSLDFRVTPAVLIPRADSELIVDLAIERRPDAKRVLDCGTGSGALLLAVLNSLPDATGVGIERSPEALEIATENVEALDFSARAKMLLADWDKERWQEGLAGPFDLILANPPYVEDEADLAPGVRNHEPAGALFAGPEGLDAYRILIPQLPGLLGPDGLILLEIGSSQADSVSSIAEEAGFSAILHRDLANLPRVLELSIRH